MNFVDPQNGGLQSIQNALLRKSFFVLPASSKQVWGDGKTKNAPSVDGAF
jgi:hypothetical protein